MSIRSMGFCLIVGFATASIGTAALAGDAKCVWNAVSPTTRDMLHASAALDTPAKTLPLSQAEMVRVFGRCVTNPRNVEANKAALQALMFYAREMAMAKDFGVKARTPPAYKVTSAWGRIIPTQRDAIRREIRAATAEKREVTKYELFRPLLRAMDVPDSDFNRVIGTAGFRYLVLYIAVVVFREDAEAQF